MYKQTGDVDNKNCVNVLTAYIQRKQTQKHDNVQKAQRITVVTTGTNAVHV